MKEPALKIAMVIENAEGTEFIPRIIPLLTEFPLAEVLAQPFVQERVQPLMERHLAAMELIRERAELKDGVIFIDLLDRETEVSEQVYSLLRPSGGHLYDCGEPV